MDIDIDIQSQVSGSYISSSTAQNDEDSRNHTL